MLYNDIIYELTILGDPIKSQILSGFFKTWRGQYSEGDVFLWITVPLIRKIVKKYRDNIVLSDIKELLFSSFHEIRLAWILFLVEKFPKANLRSQEEIFRFYLDHIRCINNWDLVDQSAPNIIGAYLFEKKRDILYKLSQSQNLWERRISIIATLYFIRKGDYMTTFSLVEKLLSDKHDLIQKANGWMLREIGKRCWEEILESFLSRYYSLIPRTTLRYAIERFEEKRKKYWMKNLGKKS